ncbi:MAG TPA: GFA family protein [Caulobacteraceae bacterium]|nr:GFA family protein [Caulobacteraceae bacterium]
MLAGGCHCGAIRYEASPKRPESALCHCADCRRTTGAPAVAWFTVGAEDFRFTKGKPGTYVSSSHARRTFCPGCGAQITFVDDDYKGERLDVTTASLDDPAAAPVRQHIWTRSRIGWMEDLNGLPERTMDEKP